MTINPGLLGFLRGAGTVMLGALLAYTGNADHLAFLSPFWSGVIASGALAVEHLIEAYTGKALFGAVTKG